MENAELLKEKGNNVPLSYESRLVLQADRRDLKQDFTLHINCAHFSCLLLINSGNKLSIKLR